MKKKTEQNAGIPRPEHPRPGFFRENWRNLNGEWEFLNDASGSAYERGVWKEPLPDRIVVPFCPESALSGVGNRDFMTSVWYARDVELGEEDVKGRVILHFGACDYRTTVWWNGEEIGRHVGGYASFEMDATAFAAAGKNRIVVHAEDDVRSGDQPVGKQSYLYHSSGCNYTRTTGIWQTVWLEFVPETYLRRVTIDATDLGGEVFFSFETNRYLAGAEIRAEVTFGGKRAGEAAFVLGGVKTRCALRVSPVRLWGPGEGNLYDVTFRLTAGGKEIDRVRSYFGIRRVDIDGTRVLLNGKPVFQRLILDQGFYPDGVYTAPTDDALRRDIELSMAAGFNGARLHQKVFEERFLWHADRLGYLVWGEFGDWGIEYKRSGAITSLLSEWLECVARDVNRPSIVGWCPLNETLTEGWRYCPLPRTALIAEATKAADPTRPVIDVSGYVHSESTCIFDVHDYTQDADAFEARYAAHAKGEFFDGRGVLPGNAVYRGDRPYFVSEFGGARWTGEVKENTSASWGYGDGPRTADEFLTRFERLTGALLSARNISGYCYTQLTDVEQEQNGLYFYDRSPKFSKEEYARLAAANKRKAAIETE